MGGAFCFDIICTIVQWRISAIFSKIKHEKPRIRGIIFIGSRRKLAFIRIQMNRIKGFEEADIMLKHFLNASYYAEILTINYTNIIRRTVSDQWEEMIGYSDMNVQSSNIKIQSVG